ncbi:MAG: hydrogenase maturation nickel metallochaperone HypA [Hydrogenophilaceae bacterium]|nr:hydrogenase maturation nickel metallochaperone HypA [Hydrogenophilaceae bacterium]
MHELSVAQALIDEVEALIDRHQANAAVRIRLRIGPLAGVVPALLTSAFPLAAAGSRLENAELDLIEAPIRVRCQTCGSETEAAINRLLCAACGDWHTQVVSGDELLLESVELDLREDAQEQLSYGGFDV